MQNGAKNAIRFFIIRNVISEYCCAQSSRLIESYTFFLSLSTVASISTLSSVSSSASLFNVYSFLLFVAMFRAMASSFTYVFHIFLYSVTFFFGIPLMSDTLPLNLYVYAAAMSVFTPPLLNSAMPVSVSGTEYRDINMALPEHFIIVLSRLSIFSDYYFYIFASTSSRHYCYWSYHSVRHCNICVSIMTIRIFRKFFFKIICFFPSLSPRKKNLENWNENAQSLLCAMILMLDTKRAHRSGKYETKRKKCKEKYQQNTWKSF